MCFKAELMPDTAIRLAPQHLNRRSVYLAARVRIQNVSRHNYFVNLATAQRALDACSAEWVQKGVSIRDLTPQGAIDARNRQAELREYHLNPLGQAEEHDVRYEPAVSGIPARRREGMVLLAAHIFALKACHGGEFDPDCRDCNRFLVKHQRRAQGRGKTFAPNEFLQKATSETLAQAS